MPQHMGQPDEQQEHPPLLCIGLKVCGFELPLERSGERANRGAQFAPEQPCLTIPVVTRIGAEAEDDREHRPEHAKDRDIHMQL